MDLQPSDEHWYALRVTYCRELKLQEEFRSRGIDTYVPMHEEVKLVNGRRVHQLVPAIHNLLFLRCSSELLLQLKSDPRYQCLRFIMNRETRRPLIVPDVQMRHFMAVAQHTSEPVVYLDLDELHLSNGTRVRILGGVFQGVEGTFVRIRHDRRVVVTIDGVMAVATTFIHPSLIEPIGDEVNPKSEAQ